MAVADSPVVEVAEESAPLRQAGLWADAWRQLRRNPLFVGPAVVIAIFAVMAVAPKYQCADIARIARGRGRARPSARQLRVKPFSSSVFIGLPCPTNRAGMEAAGMAVMPPPSPRCGPKRCGRSTRLRH